MFGPNTDIMTNLVTDFSHRDIHFINLGFSNSYKKIGIMANYQIPIFQNLSRGLLYSKPKFVIQINYFLTKN